MAKLGQIHRLRRKKRLYISKTTKFKSDLSKTN